VNQAVLNGTSSRAYVGRTHENETLPVYHRGERQGDQSRGPSQRSSALEDETGAVFLKRDNGYCHVHYQSTISLFKNTDPVLYQTALMCLEALD
jgi:hypothetical protein